MALLVVGAVPEHLYGSPGYYPGPHYGSFWESTFPPYYSPYTSIHSALRLGPLPTRGCSTILAHIPIHIALSLIATDGLAPDPITHGRQIGPPKISSLGGL